MGCEPSALGDTLPCLATLREKLKQLNEHLNQLEKAEFSTKEEMNQLPYSSEIASLQEAINEAIRKARNEVKEIFDTDVRNIRQKELEKLNKDLDALYARNALIIKTKLKDQLNN